MSGLLNVGRVRVFSRSSGEFDYFVMRMLTITTSDIKKDGKWRKNCLVKEKRERQRVRASARNGTTCTYDIHARSTHEG